MRVVLVQWYRTVHPFLLLLAEALPLHAAPGGDAVLAALHTLPDLVARKVRIKPLLPEEIDEHVVQPMWRRAVYAIPELPAGAVDRDAYVVCVLEGLHRALRVRDIYAVPSHRWGDPRARLLAGLGLVEPVHTHLAELTGALNAAWRQLADRLSEVGDDAHVRLEPAAESVP